MSFQRANETERRIANKLVKAILAEGYVISVFDCEEFNSHDLDSLKAVQDHLATTDDDRVYFRKPGEEQYAGWVWLIWGNREDLISDYTANDVTDAIVDPIYAEIG